MLAPMFGIETVGGYRPSATDPDGHPAGRAADFMVPLTPAGTAQGDALAAHARSHAGQLGVDYVIWRQRIWSTARAAEGWRAMDDRGSATANHFDHVHINVAPGGDALAVPSGQSVFETTAADCPSPADSGSVWVAPLEAAPVTSPYGPRNNPVTGEPSFHDGVDYGGPCSTPFRAASAGVVVKAGPDPVYGHQIIVDHGQASGSEDRSSSIETRYGHMYARGLSVRVGDRVRTGQVIGSVGSDGWSTGCHLHFTVEVGGRTVDPLTFLADPPGAALGDVVLAHANLKVALSPRAFRTDLAAITAAAPDFVTLNEVANRTDSALAVPGYSFFRAPATAPANQTRSTAVLWRTARWTEVDAGRLRLVDHGPQRWDAGRSATWVVLQSAAGNRAAVVSVHHMINPARFGPQRVVRRQLYAEGMRRLQVLVEALSTHGPVLLAGDFNSQFAANDPWGPRVMLGAIGMRSTMEELGEVSTTDGGGAIDYVFFQPSALRAATQQTRPLNSDHDAVVATFRAAPQLSRRLGSRR
ncbi:peptidoglycan DD-metalloendopeptidase family protein [Gordonia jinghuaiqii]|nr:peptidoglycan DD-metalloendopeptidase family protein [Gordonia jinghuaiqii]